MERQGSEFYLPLFEESVLMGRANKRKLVTVRRPLFPSYLFVRTEGQWRFLLGTYGVSSVMQENGGVAVVPDHAIASIRAREVNGLIVLPRLPERRYGPGDAVRVTEGSFRGYSGVYDGSDAHDRVRVLLDYMGRKTPILIGEDAIEPR